MEQSEARRAVEVLRRELAEAQAVVASAQRRAAALDKLVEGYLELFPGLAEPDPNGTADSGAEKAPRGQDAVLKVMESIESKGRYWTLAAMVDALTKHGWLPESKGKPANAIRTALDRLAERDDRVHKGRGSTGTVVWYWQGEGYPPPRFAGDESTPPSAPTASFFGGDHDVAHGEADRPSASPWGSEEVMA